MKQQDYLEIIELNKGKHRPSLETMIEGRKLSSDKKKDSHDYSKDYLTFVSLENDNVISLKASDSDIVKTISVSTDEGVSWTEYTSTTSDNGTVLATLNTGDRLFIKGQNTNYGSYGWANVKSNTFKATKTLNIEGNIMSLIYEDNFVNQTSLVVTYTFTSLFKGLGVVSAKNLILPSLTLTGYCYRNLFEGCSSLVNPPKLPATTLAEQCYNNLFYNCTNLAVAPALPATSLASYCYTWMFGNTALVNAPELPATTLAWGCYNSMFQGCTNLIIAPKLPVIKLISYCYNSMFRDCISLISAPILPATTLADNCYQDMFNGCSSLNYIKALFNSILNTTCLSDWVNNVSATGTFVKKFGVTIPEGISGIPTGWTVETASE